VLADELWFKPQRQDQASANQDLAVVDAMPAATMP